MTPAEQKIYDAIIGIAKEQAVFKSELNTLKGVVDGHNGHIETLKSDRNKVIGVSWFGGLIMGFGGLVWEIFKHKTP